MDGDGSNQTRLTFTGAHETTVACSWDGTKIAFESARDGNTEIYVMNSDGTNQTRLTNSPGGDSTPEWSPDGSRITWGCLGGAICVMNADGSNQVTLISSPGVDSAPAAWSPDGTKIAFASDRGGDLDIYVMNADGSDVVRIADSPAVDQNPTWGGPAPSAAPEEPTPIADLAVVKSGSPDRVHTGGNLTYTIVVTNGGPATSTGVTLADLLPRDVSFVSATSTQGTCSEAHGTVTCNLGSMVEDASATVTITVKVTALRAIFNTARVTGNESDPDNSNNASAVTTTVLPLIPIPGMTQWGLTALVLFAGALLTVRLRRRRPLATDDSG